MNPDQREAQRLQLTHAVMSLLDGWGIAGRDVLSLLDIQGVAARHIDRFRNDRAFPAGVEIDERIEHLISIAETLHTTYPINPQMGKVWLRRPNEKLDNRAPLEQMVGGGLEGLRNVRAQLDCTYAWKLNSKEG